METIFYPDDLRILLTNKNDGPPGVDRSEEILKIFTNTIQRLTLSDDLNELLTRTVVATNRFFGAERGGIFWFGPDSSQRTPELRAACNLSRADVKGDDFHFSLSLIFKAKRENRPQVVRRDGAGRWPSQVKAFLAVPFEVADQVAGVLYHDNSYLNDCFELFQKSPLNQMANALTVYIEKLVEFTQRMENKAGPVPAGLDLLDSPEIITGNPRMREIMKIADRIAGTDSTILILGETGVGKELLARRLHNMSPRRGKSFIIIDPTTIPENLVDKRTLRA